MKNDVTRTIQLKLHERMNKKQIWSGCYVIWSLKKSWRNKNTKKRPILASAIASRLLTRTYNTTTYNAYHTRIHIYWYLYSACEIRKLSQKKYLSFERFQFDFSLHENDPLNPGGNYLYLQWFGYLGLEKFSNYLFTFSKTLSSYPAPKKKTMRKYND